MAPQNTINIPMAKVACLYYLCEMSIVKVARIINVKHQTLYSRMKQVGMTLRPQEQSMGKGEQSANWKGGVYSCCGYLRIASGENEGRLVHRLIAEKVLGRKLKESEDVHHINGDRSDNRNSNLLICSHSFHIWLHRKIDLLKNKPLFGREVWPV
jgi:hypothetical protein